MSKKDFKTFNLENEINNTVEHFKMHEFSHDTNYDAYNNYFNKKLTLTYSNKIYYYYNYTNNSDYKIIDLSYRNCELNLFKNIEWNWNIDNYNFYDTKFWMVWNHNYPWNACFLFGNLDTTTNSLNINYHNLSCNNWNLALYWFSIKNINIINDWNKVSFKWIHLKNNHLLNQLLIDNVEIWELNLENINNNFDSFEIRNCKIDKLIIRNSNLWEAVFNWVEIWKLEIENATLNECIFNWVDFKIYELWNNDWWITTKALKDNYRQLKHVMDKNWNHTEANKFFALEMQEYSKLDNLSWYEKISLWIQKFISAYWNNWLRAFCIIILFALISTLINYWIMNYFYNITIDWVLNFINLINPFFWFSKWVYESLKDFPEIYFGFVLYKIFYAILVYQLIIALKRTTKR